MPRTGRLCVLALLLHLIASSSSTLNYCPSTRYLTDPVVHRSLPTLVYDVTVSNYELDYPAEEIFSFSSPFDIYCWCSGTNILPQNITIDFTEPLVIHGMLLGGYGSGSRSYVTAFSLEYSETDNSDVIVDHLPKVFYIPDSHGEVTMLNLPQPILAKTLYFQVRDYESSTAFREACWTLGLFGCTLSDATVMTSSSSLPPNPTPSPRGNPSQQLTGVESSSSGEAVGIAVSTAAGTVIAVAVLVIVGVGLCWAIHNGYILSRPRSDNIKSSSRILEREGTLARVDNELYTLPDKNRERGVGYEQIRESTSSGRGLLPSEDLTDTSPAVSTVATPTITESLTQSVVYELVQPTGDGGKAGGESLVDNPAYLAPNAGYEPVIPRSNDSAF